MLNITSSIRLNRQHSDTHHIQIIIDNTIKSAKTTKTIKKKVLDH